MSRNKIAFASAAVAMGVAAFASTMAMTEEAFGDVWVACLSAPSNMTAFEEEYHPYEPRVGGFLVCFSTVFMDELAKLYPIGLVTYGIALICFLPVSVLINVEAGRSGISGPVRYPTFLLLLNFLLGEFVFPAVWVTGYILGRSSPHGTVSLSRARIAVPLMLVSVVLSTPVFFLNSNTYAWTLAAGLLAGPVQPLARLFTWNMSPPETNNSRTMQQTTQVIVSSYVVSGILALVGWICIVYAGWSHYGSDISSLYADLWGQAEPSVEFMTIDVLVFYFGIMIYLAYCRTMAAVEAIILTPLLGPGAACALAMAQLEYERGEIKAKGA